MTRDEQIAQLKPGADVLAIGFVPGQAKFLRHVAGQVELLVRALNHTMSTEWVDEDALIFPPPPPPPKAAPGVVYYYKRCDAYRVWLVDGTLFRDQAYPARIDFDPAVWAPLDGEESK